MPFVMGNFSSTALLGGVAPARFLVLTSDLCHDPRQIFPDTLDDSN